MCVCSADNCNSENYTSEAPPVTPGSGLYCFKHQYGSDDPIGADTDYEACDR